MIELEKDPRVTYAAEQDFALKTGHYFAERIVMNAEGQTDYLEERISSLTSILRGLGNGHWSGGEEPTHAIVLTAPEGSSLKPREGDRRQLTQRTFGDSLLTTDEGGRKFKWGVLVEFSFGTPPVVYFLDAETDRIGVHDSSSHEYSVYFFPEEQEAMVSSLENYLGQVFQPGQEPGYDHLDISAHYDMMRSSAA